MKPTIKIRFTEPQIALLMRAYPNCKLDRLTELCFEFNQTGKIVDCIGTIKEVATAVTMPAVGSRACTREHAANWQLGKPAQRFCNSQMARGLPSVLLNVVVLGRQPQCATLR
jgi:hypothetical protein